MQRLRSGLSQAGLKVVEPEYVPIVTPTMTNAQYPNPQPSDFVLLPLVSSSGNLRQHLFCFGFIRATYLAGNTSLPLELLEICGWIFLR
jgi:hypothetical protein